MKYTHLINQMKWSFSRLTAFEDCPYKFYLTYIEKVPKKEHFFSDYGSFVHLVMEKYLKGELKREDLVTYYILNFREYVKTKAPTEKIFKNYFEQGIDYFMEIPSPQTTCIGIEKDIEFFLDGKKFVGFIDVVSQDENGINIIDHKSRNLKPRGKGKKPTLTDKELDEYLRQLYIYSISIKEEFGVYPKNLIFNCFRTRKLVVEPFNEEVLEAVKNWAISLIEEIREESDWEPNIEDFKCKHICSVSDSCEYYQLYKN